MEHRCASCEYSPCDLGTLLSASRRRLASGLLLVTLLDGKILALEPDLGTVSWILDLGVPLLSSSGIWFENSPKNEDSVSHSILPGADGSLYIFTDASGVSQVLEVLLHFSLLTVSHWSHTMDMRYAQLPLSAACYSRSCKLYCFKLPMRLVWDI